MTNRRAEVEVDREGILIRAPLDASEKLLVAAARQAHHQARSFRKDRAANAQQLADMRARTDVFDLHARLDSWDKTAKAIANPDDPTLLPPLSSDDRELAERIRPWAESRILGPREGGQGRGDLTGLDVRTLMRWANGQWRYESLEGLARQIAEREADTSTP